MDEIQVLTCGRPLCVGRVIAYLILGLVTLLIPNQVVMSSVVLIVLLYARGTHLVAFAFGWFASTLIGCLAALWHPSFAMEGVSLMGTTSIAIASSMGHASLFAIAVSVERRHPNLSGWLLVLVLLLPCLPQLSALLPFALIIPASAIFPVQGVGALFVLSLIVFVVRWTKTSRSYLAVRGRRTMAAMGLGVICSGIAAHGSPVAAGVSAHAIFPEGSSDVRERSKIKNQSQFFAEIEDGLREKSLILAPEGALGVLNPYAILKLEELHILARRHGSQAIIGAYQISEDGTVWSGTVMLGYEATSPRFEPATQVLPLVTDPAAGLAVRGNTSTPTRSRLPDAPTIVICYEELLASTIWRLSLRHKGVVLANHWWDRPGLITSMQRNYGRSWEALLGYQIPRVDVTDQTESWQRDRSRILASSSVAPSE